MQICRSVEDIRSAVAGFRQAGASIGLVPTMGALHAGHLHLMAEARGGADRVIATIFVNPTQFGSALDLEKYPRTEARDIALLETAGVDAVFIPEAATIYPPDAETIVETTQLANVFHGLVRPGHFRGVATVVTKLFNIVAPDAAWFGEKDYQQLAVIRRMVRDLFLPIRINGVATQREADGLAMSSRNVRLSPEDRATAPILNLSLNIAEEMVAKGTTVDALVIGIRSMIEAEWRARFKACDVVWAEDFTPASGPVNRPVGVMISAEFGPKNDPVLLIDQREISPPR